MSNLTGYDAWKTTEPEHELVTTLDRVTDAYEHARANTLDEVVAWLELAGERRIANGLRRAFDHWPTNHVCTLVGGCCDCGRRE